MIPRIIHQIYLGGDVPSVLQRNINDLKARNPGWTHRLWGDEQALSFVRAHWGEEMASIYEAIDERYASARSDLLRHLLIHAFGGVYFDIKSGSSKPLDEVIRPDDSYILAQWPEGDPCFYDHRALSHIAGGEFVSFFIASEPAHPFTQAVIERVVRNVTSYRPWSPVGKSGAVITTGPIPQTLAIYPILKDHPHRLATFYELGLYCSMEDYDHFAVFPDHYSRLTIPVVKLSRSGEFVSAFFAQLRELKRKFSNSSTAAMNDGAPEGGERLQ